MRVERLPTDQMLAAANWVRTVIDKPWRAGAQGPDAFDCWGLARATQRELAGVDLPIINADPNDLRRVMRLIQEHPLHQEWEEVSAPSHLDVVLMAHARNMHHIGTWLALDDGVILHAAEQFTDGKSDSSKPGVMAEHIDLMRPQGWMKFQFMRRRVSA